MADKKKRTYLKDLNLRFASLVGNPAQEHARCVVIKSKDQSVPGQKVASGNENHQGTRKQETTHMDPEKLAKELDAAKAKLEKLEQDNADLKARALKAEQVAALSDAEKGHFNSLPEDERADYLKLPRERRVKAADESVIYKAADGTTYRRGEEKLADLHKSNDKLRDDVAKERQGRDEERIAKLADETIGDFALDAKGQVALMKAVATISDADQREAVLKSLRAANAQMEGITKQIGSGDGETIEGDDKFDSLVKAHMKQHKCDESTATTAVWNTDEGRQAYNEVYGTH